MVLAIEMVETMRSDDFLFSLTQVEPIVLWVPKLCRFEQKSALSVQPHSLVTTTLCNTRELASSHSVQHKFPKIPNPICLLFGGEFHHSAPS